MKELTKQMLDNWKIRVEFDSTSETGYRVYHYSQIPGKAEFSWKEIKQSLNRRHHPKSGNTKRYYIISFSDYANNKKGITIPLHRLVWAYFVKDIPAGYDVSHKNDDSFNNYLDLDCIENSNLECITHKENINKRKCKWANQYGLKLKDRKEN